ncbi:lysozyme inhibitor LprI family protein [Acinetobacter sp. TSRC1-2]|uniref:lysozyme inhibitor LprI family protein n=1 Tax=unclassified Acinetobacter TaxID=196816 RepID=UPI003CEBD9D5
MRFLLPVIFSMAALGSTSVLAQGYSDEYNKCLNTSYGQTETVKKCVEKELKSQEKRLNKYYKNYLKNSGNNQSNVEQQHRLWVNRVNQQCYLKVTSSLLKVKQEKCVLEMTMERAYYYQIK